MADTRTFPLLLSEDDRAAALYLGHLAVAAEAALPDADPHTQVALCWLCAHILNEKSRLWRLTLEEIEIGERQFGSWRITARTTPGAKEHITLERHATLIEDGRQIIALSQPFHDGKAESEAIDSLVTFSAMQICSQGPDLGRAISVQDLNGTRISLEARPDRRFFGKIFPLFSKS